MLYICTVVQFLNMGGRVVGANGIGNLGRLGNLENLVFAPCSIVPKFIKLLVGC